MDNPIKLTLARLQQLPAKLERCLNDLLTQKIQVVEFRAQLNEADAILLQLNEFDSSKVRWPDRLNEALADLRGAMELLNQFWTDAGLAGLDQSIVKLRSADFALQEALGPQPVETDPPETPPAVKVQRWNQVTRAAFTCQQCGWELGYSREIESDEFLDLELEQFECPLCHKEG